jgi:hypothetical protein
MIEEQEPRREEEIIESDEPGRFDKGESGADRQAGGTTARNSTGINAEEEDPIDPDSPSMPPA